MAVNNWVWVGPLSLLVALSGIFYAYPYPVLNLYGGRATDAKIHTTWLHHGPVNNDKCRTNSPCGYPETREAFYPPMNRHDTESAATYHEYFVKYDIKTDKATKMKIEGLDSSHDLILHGIDLYLPEDDKSKIYIFAVNHDRKGEAIVLFSHTLGTDVLTYEREFRHPAIKTPNAVAATSLSSFFITNDHYFYGGGPLATILRSHEDHWGPWKWATDVVYCNASSSDIDCRTVSPPNAHPSANGALLVDDGKTLLINDVVEATTTVYDVDPETKVLSVRKKVFSNPPPPKRNVTNSLFVEKKVFPDVPALIHRLSGEHLLDTTLKGEAAILRLVKARDYEPELLYWDDGSLITVLTGAAVDPKHGKIIAGGVVERHFIVCDVDV
ncbi:Pon2 [Fonsecaea pedrosoi]|nr:Pon2 [Fonsecaea pedrosoi]